MERYLNRALLGLAACAALLSGELRSQEPAQPDGARSEILRSEPIDSGYVILNGRYLPPPYVLEKRGNDLWVNDQLAIADWFNRPMGMRGRGDFRGGGRDGEGRGFMRGGPRGRRMPDSPDEFALSQPEMVLRRDGLLLGGEGLRGCVLSSPQAASVVDILMSEESSQEKLALILDYVPDQMDESGWQHLIADFVPSGKLIERMGPEIERIRLVVLENDAKHQAAVASVFWTSQPVKYVITLAAMGLVLAACGTLLNYRPTSRARWSEIDTKGDGVPVVVRSVVLLVLLGIFDLGCTLVAQQAGGFTELNPLGSRIVENPLLLISFKLTTLLSACGILFALRRYRGAQVASWWMCLVCTVLTFRWLTYNSMFMT